VKISIRYKFILAFSLIFLLSGIILNVVTSRIVLKSTEDKIIDDMATIQQTSREYLKQFFTAMGIKPEKSDFAKNGKMIANTLSDNFNCSVSIYTLEGVFIYQALAENAQIPAGENSMVDISDALYDKSSVQIRYVDGKYITYFSYPLTMGGKAIGIIRFVKDYSGTYNYNRRLLNLITIFTIILFGVVFIFTYLLSATITRPLIRLNNAFSEVASGNYNFDPKIKNRDEVGELTNNFIVMRKKIEEQIKTIEDEKNKIIRLQKQRNEFFNNVTHELKTPLTTIYGYAQIIGEDDFNDREFYDRAVDKIKSESQRLHKMVVDLIEVSKKSTIDINLNFDMINLTEIISEISADMQFKAEKYDMKIVNSVKQINAYASPDSIRELFINLIDNAIKYGNSESIINIYGEAKGKCACITVENQGKEIPQDKIDKVFEPFFRINSDKNEEMGSIGLGLYISKNIIDMHNGSINIESSNNTTKVNIKIPLVYSLASGIDDK
jgi:signal transduction histidine kinase